MDFRFCEVSLHGLIRSPASDHTRLPGPGGADLFFKLGRFTVSCTLWRANRVPGTRRVQFVSFCGEGHDF